MSKPFFQEHPGLGSMFDYNRNGKVDLPEAIGMGGIAHAYARQALKAAEDAECEVKKRQDGFLAYAAATDDDEGDSFDDDVWDDDDDEW